MSAPHTCELCDLPFWQLLEDSPHLVWEERSYDLAHKSCDSHAQGGSQRWCHGECGQGFMTMRKEYAASLPLWLLLEQS